MSLYARLRDTLDRLLLRHGLDVTIRRTDPRTAQVTELVTRGVFTRPNSYAPAAVSVDLADANLVASAGVEPLDTDRIVTNGSWVVMHVEPIRPAELVIGYRLTLRRDGR